MGGAKADDVQATLEKAWGCKATPFVSPQPIHSVVIVRPEGKFTMVPPMDKLPIVSMTEPMDDFVAAHPDVKIGYVHGEEPVEDAVKTGKATGLLLPKLDKSRFLETVHAIGTLPRKAFSMGEANEKRFYRRQLVTLFSAPNYCGEFDNAGAMMSVDETLMCSFQILKPAEKRQRFPYQGGNQRPGTPQGQGR